MARQEVYGDVRDVEAKGRVVVHFGGRMVRSGEEIAVIRCKSGPKGRGGLGDMESGEYLGDTRQTAYGDH